ncbi:MAG: hypothetical protein JEZ03_11605 [Bacteroidales bacterium]|nr:hypothetical protein [Bacteroidales bacterium]
MCPFYGVKFSSACFALTLFGVVQSIFKKEKLLVGLLFSLFIQIVAVLMADILKSYSINSRQFLIFLPFTYFFIAKFIDDTASRDRLLVPLNNSEVKPSQILIFNQWLSIILIAFLTLSSIPSIQNYFQFERSYSYEISLAIQEEWQADDQIWVIPQWDTLIFRYYLEKELGDNRMKSSLIGMELEDLSGSKTQEVSKTFLITPAILSKPDLELIRSLGFTRHELSRKVAKSQILWIK